MIILKPQALGLILKVPTITPQKDNTWQRNSNGLFNTVSEGGRKISSMKGSGPVLIRIAVVEEPY